MSCDECAPCQIRVSPAPYCHVCGSEGNMLYQDQQDVLYEAPGLWSFKLCSNADCGLMWLDPMPTEQDINNAYSKYYTHPKAKTEEPKITKVLLGGWRKCIHPVLSFANPVRGERERVLLMYLNDFKPGRVLDVGCGNGSRLAQLRQLGWDVYGQDVDPEAVAHAQKTFGLEVRLGRLEDTGFPEMFFDCIILNHVVEHVHDPVKLLKQCRRLLRKGGLLVAVTPNSKSLGHKHFRASWRGLEPPRHVHIFSSKTLSTIAVRAGFTNRRSWTTAANASIFAYESLLIRSGGNPASSLRTKLYRHTYAAAYQFFSMCKHLKDADSGEECVLQVIH